MAARPRVRVGLRARLVVALVATSLATLLGATLFLVPPLSERLEHDQIRSIRPAVRAAARSLRESSPHDLRAGSPAILSVLFDLQRQAGGRTALFDGSGRLLGTFPRGPGGPGFPGDAPFGGAAGAPGRSTSGRAGATTTQPSSTGSAGATTTGRSPSGPSGTTATVPSSGTTTTPAGTGGRRPTTTAADRDADRLPDHDADDLRRAAAGDRRPGRRTPDLVERVTGGAATVRQVVHSERGATLVLVVRKPLRESRAAAAVVRRSVPAAGAIGLAVAVLLAALVSTGLLRRLRLLRDDARALGDEGLAHRIRVGPRDEVGEVAAALEDVRARLVEEERLRQAFLATASHELRTPLAGLLGTLELLREEVGEDAARDGLRHRADTALERTRRLVDLSGELLHLSRLDAGEAVEPADIELAGTVRGASAGVGDLLRGDGRALDVRATGEVPVRADPKAVTRIVENLLENARRYGRGTVTVEVGPGRPGSAGTPVGPGADDVPGGAVRHPGASAAPAVPEAVAVVRVRDEGPGISGEERERIFRRFERGVAAEGAGSGFGLGLAIARDLARRMGGDLRVGDGAPTTFVLTLPVPGPGAASRPADG